MRKIVAKNALVYGKGISGTGAKAALEKCGVNCTICDDTDFEEKFIGEYDLIVVSPSIPRGHKLLKSPRKRTRK